MQIVRLPDHMSKLRQRIIDRFHGIALVEDFARTAYLDALEEEHAAFYAELNADMPF